MGVICYLFERERERERGRETENTITTEYQQEKRRIYVHEVLSTYVGFDPHT